MGVDYKRNVCDYVSGVLSGDIVAGSLIKASAQRYLDDLEHADERGFWFDEERAAAMISIFPTVIKHTTGQYHGKPFVPYDFQEFTLWQLFGWRRKDDGMRRFRELFYSCARGNGKSPFAAALLLTLFVFDWPTEMRSECYSVAGKKDQARIIFDEVKRYIEQSPDLRNYVDIFKLNLSIAETHSKLEPLASDSKNIDGLIIHAVAIDEIHAWTEHDRELHEKIVTATVTKRRQPVIIYTTTAGNDESTLWREQYNFSKLVAQQQVVADQHLSIIFEIDDEDDPLAMPLETNAAVNVWPKANPMLACSDVVKLDGLLGEAKKAQTQPETFLRFKRYHCNKFVRSTSKLITPEMWACGNGELPDIPDGSDCYAGFDFGARDDLAALVLLFPMDLVDVEGEFRRRYAPLCWAWCPEECPRDLQREPWATWIRTGQLTVTGGNTTDVQAIYDTLEQLSEKYNICSLAFDGNNAREFGTRAENEFGIETYAFPQTCSKYNEPTKSFVVALEEGRILHGGHDLLAWCCLNMSIHTDTRDYIMPSKRKSESKIDMAVALIMALSEATFAERPVRSVYEERGPIML